MNEELYAKLLNACAVFAVRVRYDALIRKQLDVITEKNRKKMLLIDRVYESKKWNVENAKAEYEKAVKEDIDPAIKQANEEIAVLSAEEKVLWVKNQPYLEFLPVRYRTEIAVSFMMSAIKNCRADTLKEVINLYEETVAQWKLEKSLDDAVKMQKKHNEYMAAASREIRENQKSLYQELQDIKFTLDKYQSNW